MNWELISNQHNSLQEYRLTDNNKSKVIVKYNPRHQSARLTHGIHQRLFFLESAGSLSGKTIFRNEYGMETGNTASVKLDNSEGYIMIDTKKYHYQLQNNPQAELVIFDNDPHHPLASCNIDQPYNPQNKSCLLLSLCWYASLSVEKETEMEYLPL